MGEGVTEKSNSLSNLRKTLDKFAFDNRLNKLHCKHQGMVQGYLAGAAVYHKTV